MECNRCFWYCLGIKTQNNMNFSEKLLILRNAKNLTQEQLAEKLDVTTDYSLKSSEIDDLSVKKEMLEKRQQNMLIREQKQQKM